MKILSLPIHGLWFVFEKLVEEVERAQEDDAEALRAELVRAYEEWQAGAISEAAFEARERGLARRLSRLQSPRRPRKGH